MNSLALQRTIHFRLNGKPVAAKQVRDSRYQRDLRAHDGKIYFFGFCKTQKSPDILRGNRHAAGHPGDAAVARGADDFLRPRALRKFPHQRMLTPPAAYNENF